MKAVIFDFDGVLFETPTVYYEIYHAIADEMGVDRFESFSDWQIALYHANGDWRRIFNTMGIEEQHHEKAEKIFELRIHDIGMAARPYQGVDELMRILIGKGIKTGIVSSNYTRYIHAMLQRHGLKVDVVVGYEFGILKPRPEPLLHCMQQLGCDKESALYIGDMRVDIEAGRNAGVQTLIVSYGLEPEELLRQSHPDTIIHSSRDILSYV